MSCGHVPGSWLQRAMHDGAVNSQDFVWKFVCAIYTVLFIRVGM